jgi:hypothetical protein
MNKHIDSPKSERKRLQGPLSQAEILLQENVPASEPVPAGGEREFTRKSFVIQSDDKDFDPRQFFSKVKGSPGLWE